jgi:acyl-CoA synthetase (AMP-forming)/AMP-acid ligase II
MTILRWTPPADRYGELLGPGAPFQIAEETVLGVRHEVFVRRLPHLRALLQQGAARFGDRPYLVDGDRVVSFVEAARLVAATAAALREEHGIGGGDHVAVAAANRYEHVLVAWAVTVLGGVLVELNGWWTGTELEHGIELTEPVLLIGDGPRLDRLEGRVPSLPRVDLGDAWSAWSTGVADLPDMPIDEDDPFVILFTSGTTGRSKGAVLTHRNNLHWIQSIALRSAAAGVSTANPCEVAALPLFHISGLNCQAISSMGSGTTIVYMPSPGKWTAEHQLALTERHQVTTWRLVPTKAWRLLEHPNLDRYDLSSLQSIVGGGSVWAPALLERLGRAFPQARQGLLVGLGMTETNGTGATAAMPGLLDRPGNVGGPPPAASIRVCKSRGDDELPDTEVGEIQIRSASVFPGYHGDPEATAAALNADRWFRTGDFGFIADGRLFIEGRRSDLILRGGENIYPAEIEHRLRSHPDVDDVAVVGVPHRELGEEVRALVVRRPGSTLDAAAVRTWSAQVLAPFKVPAHVEFRDRLPRNAAGKVVKHLLEANERVPFAED